MNAQRTKLLPIIILLLSVIFVFPAGSLAKSYEKIIAFGDSLSDHHGLETYIGLHDPLLNPNGAFEAWTNGDVWVEYLADILNAGLDNNAIAGAMTAGHENDSIQAASDAEQLPQLGLVGQINRFSAENSDFLPADTLFTIWIGGNDLLKYGRGESAAASVEELITNAVDNTINAMSVLAAEGASNFLVINLPDLGKTPTYNTKTPAEIAAVSSLSFSFNTALENGINNFKTLFPGVTVYTFDVYNFLNGIISNETFVNPTGTYMVLDEDGNKTGETNEPAEDYLFWDTIHPTTKAHELVAIEVANNLSDDNEDDYYDDDDDSCFICTASVNCYQPEGFSFMLVILSAVGLAGILLKKN